MNEEGRVLVQFQLNDGEKPSNVKLVNTSGSARLDEASVRILAQGLFGPGEHFLFRKDELYQATVIYCLYGDNCSVPYPNSIPIYVSAKHISHNFDFVEPETRFKPVLQGNDKVVGEGIRSDGPGKFTLFFEALNIEPVADLSKPLVFEGLNIDCSALANVPTGPFAARGASPSEGQYPSGASAVSCRIVGHTR
jgi:hypothetical protein